MNQALLHGSTEYHLTASSVLRTIVEKKLISPEYIIQNFLHSILNCVDSRDAEISRTWFETLLVIISILPITVIHREILPAAIAKSAVSKPVVQRLMSCRMLGRIAQCCDAYVLKKDVFPLIQALTQDNCKEVRAAICVELPFCAAVLSKTINTDLLPILNEFANDEESIVRVAAYQTMVDILDYLSPELLKNSVIPLFKKMTERAFVASEDGLKLIVSKNFGKVCIGTEKSMTEADKVWMLERFTKLSQLGLPQMKFKDRVAQKQMTGNPPHSYNLFVECRLNCAYNVPAMLQFASGIENFNFITTLYPIICDLTSDPYFYVRRTIAAGMHEVSKILASNNGQITREVIKLLKDDAEEVLQSLVPHLKDILESFCQTKTLMASFVDETAIEITRALRKCESEIASTYNWRLHSLFLQQLEVLPKCMPSDFIYTQFVPLVLKRTFSCRPLPCRLAAVRTTLVFLRYNLKSSQRAEIRSKLINDLCCSEKFYDRVIFVKSCPEIIDLFSSNYFREFFFVKTLQLVGDKVANIRLLAVSLLPQLKMIAKAVEKNVPKFSQMVDSTLRVASSSERDSDVRKRILEVSSTIEKWSSYPFKSDPKDVQKFEEEKYLSTLTSGKELKTQVNPLSSVLVARPRLNVAENRTDLRKTSSVSTPSRATNANLRTQSSPQALKSLAIPVPRTTLAGDTSVKGSSVPPLTSHSLVRFPASTISATSLKTPHTSTSVNISPNTSFSGSSLTLSSSTSSKSLLLSVDSNNDDNDKNNRSNGGHLNNDDDDDNNNNNSNNDSCINENKVDGDNSNGSNGKCITDNKVDCDNNSINSHQQQKTLTVSVTERSLKIPVKRYSNKQKLLLRRHSSSYMESNDNDYSSVTLVEKNENSHSVNLNNNNNNNKKRVQPNRRPHSMILQTGSKVRNSFMFTGAASTSKINNINSNSNIVSRLPVRSSRPSAR
ncbi:serine/threonine-protein phosphatase 4 regulatory subunit 4-like isoform X2 [Lycorma delicatula]